MKNLFVFISIFYSFYASSQVICGTANENGSVTLTAPAGQVFTSIEFASYGTPTGTCATFAIGACHATNSLAIVQAAFIGRNSATINATNGVFGDPCNGTVKSLFIRARHSSTLPLTLLSFTAQKAGQTTVKLNWSTSQEVQTSMFIIERSIDGIDYSTVGTVQAMGTGAHNYTFTDNTGDPSITYYYRLKMVDQDGRHQFSSISRISNDAQVVKLSVYPNPAVDIITIVSDRSGESVITNSTGQSVQKVWLFNGSQSVNISHYKPGMYFLKTGDKVISFIKK